MNNNEMRKLINLVESASKQDDGDYSHDRNLDRKKDREDDYKFIPLNKRKKSQQGVAEGSRVREPSGNYRDPHTGRLYSSPDGKDGNDGYRTPEYMLDFYKKKLAQIAASPYKRTKEVAQLQAKIAKLEKQGMAEVNEADNAVEQSKIEQIVINNDLVQGIKKLMDVLAYDEATARREAEFYTKHVARHRWNKMTPQERADAIAKNKSSKSQMATDLERIRTTFKR